MAKLSQKVTELKDAPASRVVVGKDISLAPGEEREQFLQMVADRFPNADVDETKSGMVCEVTIPGMKGSNIHVYADHATVINALLDLADGYPVIKTW